MLTTLLPPTAGMARVAGHDVVHEGPKVRAAIGAALQEAALDPLLTGREHLRLQATLQGIPRTERRARCDELLDRVGLTDAADRKVRGYSGGMKRRLDLALALVHRPRILFLDEPTTGLDIQSRTALWAGGRAARARRGRHRLPHDAVPRGGRRARRPGRDHRPRAHRRRGHAGRAQGGDRAAERPRDAGRRRRRRPGRGGAAAVRRAGRRVRTRDIAVRLADGDVRPRRRRSRAGRRGLVVANLELQQPTLDDVFLAKTGRSLEGADDEDELAAAEATAAGDAERAREPGRRCRPPVGDAHAAPAGQRDSAARLPGRR